jgi:hypothetical protein
VEANLVELRAQLRRLRQVSNGDLKVMLARMQRDCHALVSTVQNIEDDANEPLDLEQIKTVVATLGNSIDAIVNAALGGTFREVGGPEEMLDEMIASGRQPTAEELTELVQAVQAAMK